MSVLFKLSQREISPGQKGEREKAQGVKKDSFDSEVSDAMKGGGLSPGNANKLSTANHLQKIEIFLSNHSFLFYPCGCVFHSDIHPDSESDTCERGIWLGMLKLRTQA